MLFVRHFGENQVDKLLFGNQTIFIRIKQLVKMKNLLPGVAGGNSRDELAKL